MVATQAKKPEIRLGDKVGFRIGLVDAKGTIIEDRGPLAGQGRHIYRIAFRFDEDYDRFIELAEGEFLLLSRPAGASPRRR